MLVGFEEREGFEGEVKETEGKPPNALGSESVVLTSCRAAKCCD